MQREGTITIAEKDRSGPTDQVFLAISVEVAGDEVFGRRRQTLRFGCAKRAIPISGEEEQRATRTHGTKNTALVVQPAK